MPFEVLETETRGNETPRASLSYLRHVRKGKEMDRAKVKPKLIITLPTVICISKKKRFYILVGTGQDSGKIRLVGTDEERKGVKPSEFKSFLVLRFGYVPALGDEIFDGAKCDICKISEDTYEIDAGVLFKEAAVAILRAKTKAVS